MELVLFELAQGRYAMTASSVVKVLDLLPVTPLPYAPADVEGLVNVAGSVLLKVNLAARLGLPLPSTQAEGHLLVINAQQETVVVQVDKVFSKVNLEDGVVKTYESHGDDSMIRGEFSTDEGMVLLLDERTLGLHDMDAVGVPDGGGGLIGMVQETTHAVTEAALNEFQTVTVRDGGETYAFMMDQVMEIVEIRSLTALPGAGNEVEGLMDLRGKALLVVSLARLLACEQINPPRFVLVVSLDGSRLGISVTDIVGIERYAKESIQAIAGGDSQLEGYLPGAGDRAGKMTGLISPAGLVSPDKMAKFKRYLNEHGVDMSSLSDRELRSVRRLLAFRLGHERCALPLSSIDRVEEFTPSVNLPQGDESLAGVVQIKGEVAPVLDLREMLGVPKSPQAVYVVVRVGGTVWALIVDKVDRVIEIAEKDIAPVRTSENDYLTEVGRLNGELISLLSLEPLSRLDEVAA
jgi:purine-binding chemotaxis protein CheW